MAMAKDAGHLSVVYFQVPGRESPKTTIVITVRKKEQLSYRSPKGEAVYSTIKLLSEQLGRISKTFELDICSIIHRPDGETRMRIASLFCEVGMYEPPEYLLVRAAQLADFLKEEALKLKEGKGNAVNAAVGYDYSVRGLQIVELEHGVAAQAADTDAPVLYKQALVMFDRQELNMPMCGLCLLDFDHGFMVSQLPCRHIFHPTCLDGWLQDFSFCPFCCH